MVNKTNPTMERRKKKKYKRRKKIVTFLLIFGYAIFIIFFVFMVCLFSKHEEKQNQKINKLQKSISLLEEKIEEVNKNKKVEYSNTTFNYFALGNSITKHALADYWWNEIGMAASTKEKDYVHLISSFLEREKGEVCQYALNYYTWEVQATDRAEAYELLDPYLDKKLNLVTIQLSENVTEFDTYEEDYESLIKYIQIKAPNAQIIVIDDFWSGGEKSVLKKQAAQNTGVDFVSLSEIRGDAEYQCGMGTIVYDADGGKHVVDFEGVSKHPGDKGMKYIADAVIAKIR